ncbi:MAG: Zn-ribbon domain-containing OB-fold protein [Candidatus Thermoplasmatota archaeon]
MSVPRFWREIPERYNLQASKCGVCQAIHFPPREVCPTCRRASIGKMTAVRLSGRGRILEWTRVHKPAPGYAMQVPYVVALIQSEEGPIITGTIVDSDPTAIRGGAPVHSVFRRLGQDGDDGVIYYGTKWQVAPARPASPEPVAEAPKPKKGKRLALRRSKGK